MIPFQVACGHSWMCSTGLQAQCETTQVRSQGMGATLFGYTKLVRRQGRGTDSVIDAVGMEAHGSPGASLAHQMALLPDVLGEQLMKASPGEPPTRCRC